MKKGVKYLVVLFSSVFLLTILIPAQSLISQEQTDEIQLISVTPPKGTILQRGTEVPFEVKVNYKLESQPSGFVTAGLSLLSGEGIEIGQVDVSQGDGNVVINGLVDVEDLYNWVETDTVYLEITLEYWVSEGEANVLDFKCLTEYPYYIKGEAPSFEKHLRIPTRPYLPIAELSVNYEWVDKSDEENIYKVSKIQIKLVGFTGVYQIFIRDRYKNTLWSDWGWCRINLIKSYPFEAAPFTVSDSCEISISLGGVDDITTLVKPLLKFTDWYIKAAEKLLAGPYAILIPHNVIYDMFKPEDVKIWEASPIAFAKSSTTQFYPESPINIFSNIRDFFVNAYNNVKEFLLYKIVDELGGVAIAVYLKDDISEELKESIEKEIKSWEEVKEVKYISKEQALERFKEQNKGSDILKEIEGNPLPASFEITLKSYKKVKQVAPRFYDKDGNYIEGVEDISKVKFYIFGKSLQD